MLILTRKEGQRVLINDGAIQVKVMKVKGDIVYIGFDAASNINIDREEKFFKKVLDLKTSKENQYA